MLEINYGPFSESTHIEFERAAAQTQKRIPVQGMIELTRLCSIKCTHCYIGEARWIKDSQEMTTEQIKSVLDVLYERGTLWLTFTGGEAMIRRDFKELWKHAKEKGFILTLFSNATLITKEMAEFLKQYPPFLLDVTIYGATEETYEKVSLVKGSYKRFLQGIENIRANQLRWELKACGIKENIHEIDAMNEMAKQWGTKFRYDLYINPSIGLGKEGDKAPCSTRLESHDLVKADFKYERKKEYDKLVTRDRGAGRSEKLYGCGAGETSFYINARGLLQMCILTAHRGHKLINDKMSIADSFDWGWDSFGKVREIKRRPDSPCLTCDIAVLCESCPGFSQLENGDEQGVVEYLCRTAHAKAKAMGVKHECSENHYYAREIAKQNATGELHEKRIESQV